MTTKLDILCTVAEMYLANEQDQAKSRAYHLYRSSAFYRSNVDMRHAGCTNNASALMYHERVYGTELWTRRMYTRSHSSGRPRFDQNK